jgi:PLD-like domain
MTQAVSMKSGIRDNRPSRGTVASFLKGKIHPGANLSFVSAYFTIFAYEALKEQLDQAERLRFLFGEPSFIQGIDPEKRQRKSFRIEDDVLKLTDKLEQKRIARECADWISARVDIRTVIRESFLHGKMYHIANQEVEEAILGSSNFTVHGLGLAANGNNIELNLEVDSNRDRRDLKAWFDELWNDETLVRDVKAEVLSYLEQLYQDQSPSFSITRPCSMCSRGFSKTPAISNAVCDKLHYSRARYGTPSSISKRTASRESSTRS